MQGFFMRDTLEDAVIAKIKGMSSKNFSRIAAQAFNVVCEPCDPIEGDFIVEGIEECPELHAYIPE